MDGDIRIYQRAANRTDAILKHMSRTVIQFILVAIIVAIIGGFTGWYFFIQGKVQDTEAADLGRGSSDNTSFTGEVGSTYQNIVSDITTDTGNREIGKRAPRLWQVVKSPVAGFGFADNTAAIFLAERATGNILKADPEISSIVRLTNTLVPKVREALFSRSGDVVLRSSNDQGAITTFAATIATTTAITSTSTPNVLDGVYLQENITAIDVQSFQNTSKGLFYMAKDPAGGSTAYTTTWKGASQKRLFTSALAQWRAQWLPDGRAVLTQSASDDVSGYSFMVSAAGTMRALVSNEPGLTVLHHDTSNAYLYSTSKGGVLELFVVSGTGAPVKLPVSTTADKCVWAPGVGLIAYCGVPLPVTDSAFLQKWYQGALHTTDVIWKIEAGSGTADKFFTTDTRIALDVEDMAMDEKGSYIGFRNAADKSLWLLRVQE